MHLTFEQTLCHQSLKNYIHLVYAVLVKIEKMVMDYIHSQVMHIFISVIVICAGIVLLFYVKLLVLYLSNSASQLIYI